MAHVDNLRRHFPSVRNLTYLDTGTFGVLPDVAISAMKSKLDVFHEEGRMGEKYLGQVKETRDSVRELFARLLGVSSPSVALMEHRVHAYATVINGFAMRPGDEIIRIGDDAELTLAVATAKQRHGVAVRSIANHVHDEELLLAVERAVTRRTRLIVMSHVSTLTGSVLPISAISRIAREAGALLLVDGSDAVGAFEIQGIPSDVDFYIFGCDRWLYGPDGLACMYVSRDVMSMVSPCVVGTSALSFPSALADTSFLLHDSARKYEASATNLPAWAGIYESLRFLFVTAGFDYIFQRIHGLSGQLLDQLLDIKSVDVLTSRERRAGRIHALCSDRHLASSLVAAARERSMMVGLTRNGAVSISVGIYNTEEELTRFTTFLQAELERI